MMSIGALEILILAALGLPLIGGIFMLVLGKPRRLALAMIAVALLLGVLVFGLVVVAYVSHGASKRVVRVPSPVRHIPVGATDHVAAVAVAKSAETPPATDARPDWVDAAPGKVGDAYQMVAAIGPYTTRLECDEALTDKLRAAAAEYAELYLGPEVRGRVGLQDGFLREHVLKQQWEETKSTSIGPMVLLHAQLVFDAKANQQLQQNWRDAQVRDRLWLAGRWLAAVLAVLAGMWAILKTDSFVADRDRAATRLALRAGTILLMAVALAALLLVG